MAALPDNDRMAGPYLAVAGQRDFPADFPALKAVAVIARIERGGMVLERREGELEIADPSAAGFTCRLTQPCEAGDRVWIYSALPPERGRTHTPNGVVRTRTLEDDAVEFQGQLQESRRDLGRALMFPVGDAPPELPLAGHRRETVMVFDIHGAPQVMPIPTAVNAMGGDFDDWGLWGAQTDPLTKDYGAFG